MYNFLLGLFNGTLILFNISLYTLKFISYLTIAVYLWFQYKVSEVPYSEKVQDFIDLTDKYMLPFLMFAAACEAAHLVIKLLMKLVDFLEKREIQKIEDEFKTY